MTIWRNLVLCLTLTGIVLTGTFLGCTRQIDVMPNPAALTPVVTSTPTGTATPTVTATPNGPTATFTITPTPAPPTNTFTPAPPTNTFTVTNTATQTSTATATSTPTPNYLIIDDFEATGGVGQDDTANIAQITDQNGVARNGFWGSSSDGTVAFNPTPGYASTTAIQLSGSYSIYDQLSFTFLNPAAAYDATVSGRYTGISFYAIANSFPATNCTGTQIVDVDFIDAATSTDHYVAIAVTNSWQLYTVFYNQALSKTGANVDPTGLSTVKLVPMSNGVANYDADVSFDDIQFTTATAPAAAVSPAANLVDNFGAVLGNQNVAGTGQIQYNPPNGGYWFGYTDTLGTTMCPTNGGVFFLTASSPADVGPIAAHIAGNETVPTAPPVMYPFAGMGFWMGASGTYGTDISAYTQIVYHIRSSDNTSYLFALNDANYTSSCGYNPYLYGTYGTPLTSGTTWKAVTITIASPGSSGCSSPAAPDQTTIGQWQWQVQAAGSAFDLWVDDVYLLP